MRDMYRNATLRLLVTVLVFQALSLQVKAQCVNGQQMTYYQSSINYRGHTERGMLNDAQWDKVLQLGDSYLEVPYIAGFLETELMRGWKLVDITGQRPPDAVIAAVSASGQRGHVFFADYRQIKGDDLLHERIRKADLKFYNSVLRMEAMVINSPSEAMDVSLVFLKAATHRVTGFFIQIINSSSDIPKPNDEKRRFIGILQDDTASWATDFQMKVRQLSNIVTPPQYSERNGNYDLSFFTWDPVFGTVEQWCVTVSGYGIANFSRKLIHNRV